MSAGNNWLILHIESIYEPMSLPGRGGGRGKGRGETGGGERQDHGGGVGRQEEE